jgi:hypothetical protein
MSDQNKLDFPDWLKVRDVVEAALIEAEDFPASKIAEELMVAGLIDIAAILGGEPVAEDEVASVWMPTHLYEYHVGELFSSTPVRVVRALGNTRALVTNQAGDVETVGVELLTEIPA